jgi:tagatose 1,6-diphosphate aldolase
MRECFENGTKPFVFLSAGMKFNNFLNSLELAKSSKIDFLGFLCGRSIWQDSIDIFCKSGKDNFMDWINLEGKQRLQKLKNVIIDN